MTQATQAEGQPTCTFWSSASIQQPKRQAMQAEGQANPVLFGAVHQYNSPNHKPCKQKDKPTWTFLAHSGLQLT